MRKKILAVFITLSLLSGTVFVNGAIDDENPGELINNPWIDLFKETTTSEQTTQQTEVTTVEVTTSENTTAEVTTTENTTVEVTTTETVTNASETTTVQEATKPSVTKSAAEQKKEFQKKCGKAKVKKAVKAKKSAKKIKVTLKKRLISADGYIVRFYKSKKLAKKNKKYVKQFTIKKTPKTFSVSNKKLKAKKLYIRVIGYKNIAGKRVLAKKWSVAKKVKMKK
ncbi:MAG: hypothetical protein K6G85_09540 [Eubacterium sp.]|nr:hypothetical protein [Eubacterium sp.]